MDLTKNGRIICNLRKSKGMTQKQVADKLGVVPKTISKWETGHGFPDISVLSELAGILGVSEKVLLSGDLIENSVEAGNIKKTKFYVCEKCGSIMLGTGEVQIFCCGKPLKSLDEKRADNNHEIKFSDIENDFYIEFEHEMSKEHYIGFVSYIAFDRALTVRLYPEQSCAVRFPKMYGGKLYYYCNRHGLFEYCDKSYHCAMKKTRDRNNPE